MLYGCFGSAVGFGAKRKRGVHLTNIIKAGACEETFCFAIARSDIKGQHAEL